MQGPWKWSEDGDHLLDADGRFVLRVLPSDATQEEFDAIAAVPELLAACETALACLLSLGDPLRASSRLAIGGLRAAIARARQED